LKNKTLIFGYCIFGYIFKLSHFQRIYQAPLATELTEAREYIMF